MNSVKAWMSWSTPKNALSLSLAFPPRRPNPVPGVSINTRSLTSSRLYWLSTSGYGAGAACSWSGVTTRLGPKAPMWSQTVDDPGPPLKAKVRGRAAGSAPRLK